MFRWCKFEYAIELLAFGGKGAAVVAESQELWAPEAEGDSLLPQVVTARSLGEVKQTGLDFGPAS